MLARHRGKGLIRNLVIIPDEDPACGQEQPLAGLGLQAPHFAQVIQIGGKQWAVSAPLRRRRSTLGYLKYSSNITFSPSRACQEHPEPNGEVMRYYVAAKAIITAELRAVGLSRHISSSDT